MNSIKGYTIIETLVAILISLILLAGLLQIYLNTKNIYYMQTNFVQLQENDRFIDTYLPRILRFTGYRSPPASGNFIPLTTVFANTPYVTGTNATGTNGSDTLTIAYQGSGTGTGTPDGSIRDCLNQPIDANTIATSTFSITANNQFQCQAINPNASPTNNTQVLISGVENFQVLYGEDLNNDQIADRYVNANFSGLSMSRVVSVRVCLLIRSTNPVNMSSQTITYNLLGTSFTPTNPQYIRTPITSTILFRNLTSSPT
jgi:type IV pilus assembly protein PilW